MYFKVKSLMNWSIVSFSRYALILYNFRFLKLQYKGISTVGLKLFSEFLHSWLHSSSFFSAISQSAQNDALRSCSSAHFQICAKILDPSLEKCHHVLSPTLYINRCQEDMCSCFGEKVCEKIYCSFLHLFLNDCQTKLELEKLPSLGNMQNAFMIWY